MNNFYNKSQCYTDYLIVFFIIIITAGTSFLGASIMRLVYLCVALLVIDYYKTPIPTKIFVNISIIYFSWVVYIFIRFGIDPFTSEQTIVYLSFTALFFFSFFGLLATNQFFKSYVNLMYFFCDVEGNMNLFN